MATDEPEVIQTKKVKKNLKIQPPHYYKVIYLNDDVTTAEFVKETLIVIFNCNDETAEKLTTEVHEQGSAVVAVLPYEIAETKGVEVTMLARNNGFPLQIKLKPD
jgi:ATP-dependent Clp protease adaptor protein ClpS